MKWLKVLAAALCVSASMGAAAAPGDAPSAAPIPAWMAACPPGVPLGAPTIALDQVRAALASHRDIDVLAIGSAAMLGPIGLPATMFTHRAIDGLAAARPETKFTLVARNARGALASDMLTVLRSELSAHHYDLVLWQAGSVEAMWSVPVAEFRQTLAEGARVVAEAHGSLVLIDSQFSYLTQSKVDVALYAGVMREIAALPGAVLFRRYDMTRDWVMSGQLDIEHVAQHDRQKAADHWNECLGSALVNLLVGGGPASPPPK